MTQEDKELLLIDLCARLPYGVKISIPDLWTQKREIEILDEIFKGDDGLYRVNSKGQCIEYIRPYLFPLSSMTEEQKEEYGKCYDIDLANCAKNLCDRLNGKDTINGYPMYNHIDWCNKNHFDYRGLIPMGLAIDATGLNIYWL